MLGISIFTFSDNVFSTQSKTEIIILATKNLSPAFNLDCAKILSFGKDLIILRREAFEKFFGKTKKFL